MEKKKIIKLGVILVLIALIAVLFPLKKEKKVRFFSPRGDFVYEGKERSFAPWWQNPGMEERTVSGSELRKILRKAFKEAKRKGDKKEEKRVASLIESYFGRKELASLGGASAGGGSSASRATPPGGGKASPSGGSSSGGSSGGTSSGSSGGGVPPSEEGEESMVISLPKEISGFRFYTESTSALSTFRLYKPLDGGSKISLLSISAEILGKDKAMEELEGEKKIFNRNPETEKVRGYTAYLGNNGVDKAIALWREGGVFYYVELQVKSSPKDFYSDLRKVLSEF